jgi:hypothetical protein
MKKKIESDLKHHKLIKPSVIVVTRAGFELTTLVVIATE